MPSRAATRTGPSTAWLDLPNVAEHLDEEAERLPSRALAGAGTSARMGAPANLPEPMTTKRAGQLIDENEKVIDCGASFLKNLIINKLIRKKYNCSLMLASIFKCL